MNPKDEIKDRLSITEVVATYVKLEKSGNQFRARCPFHNERTPSFYVSPERKSYHCFGCGLHGDIFSFVEKIENIPFYDALKILADRAGISLKDVAKNKEDSRLVALLADATLFYEKCLQESPEALTYVHGRGLTDTTVKTFHIGYAKNDWRTLFIHLAHLGYTPEEMEAAGVVIKAIDDGGNTKGWYDRFRGRVMFPIRNVSGATVGYSGRILPSLVDTTQAQGKYVNTPETALYHKSKILFGYDTAKKTMAETKEVVIVEGQMDLCMSYQAGVHNTVAVSGTAFTDEHIKLLKRFAERVILSFDSDNAGQAALKKSALTCLYGGLDVFVVPLEAKDPADMIMENPESWTKALAKKLHVIEYVTKEHLGKTADERELRQKIATQVIPYIVALRSPMDRDYFFTKVADMTGVSIEALKEESLRVAAPEILEEENVTPKAVMSTIDRRLRELIAYITWKKFTDESSVKELGIFPHEFPESIIEAEIVSLERFPLHEKPKEHLEKLILSYKKELLKARQQEVQALLKGSAQNEVLDQDKLLKELADLAKEINTLHK